MLHSNRLEEIRILQKKIINRLASRTVRDELVWKSENQANCHCHPRLVYVSEGRGHTYVIDISNNRLDIYNDSVGRDSSSYRIEEFNEVEDLKEIIEEKLNPESFEAKRRQHKDEVEKIEQLLSAI